MSSRLWPGILPGILILLAAAAWAGAPTRPAAAEPRSGGCVDLGQPNLLLDPSFEGAYEAYEPPGGHPQCPAGICTSVRTAAAWTPWWRIQTQDDKGYEFKMPEFTAAEESKRWYGPARAHSGDKAQQLFTLYATHEAGVYQQIAAVPGATYCFSIWGHSWTAQDDPIPELNHDSCPSPQGVGDACSGPEDGLMRQKIGIDPSGGTDWASGGIVWSDQSDHPHGRPQYDEYGLFVVTATAQAETITVFTYSQPAYAVKHNNVYWDDASLVAMASMVVASPLEMGVLATPAEPVETVQSWAIDLLNFSGGWQASVTPDGPFTPILNRTSGGSGDLLAIEVDTAGLPLGSYEAAVTISADEVIPGSPVAISVRIFVVDEIFAAYLPSVRR